MAAKSLSVKSFMKEPDLGECMIAVQESCSGTYLIRKQISALGLCTKSEEVSGESS